MVSASKTYLSRNDRKGSLETLFGLPHNWALPAAVSMSAAEQWSDAKLEMAKIGAEVS